MDNTLDMSMSGWADREIKRAIKNENPDYDGSEFDYGCSCYESAYKAYKSLLNDGHSGMSWQFTIGILDRLMNGLPLTEIDEDDFPESCMSYECDGIKTYQCPRMYSLFKEVKGDKISYSDNRRQYCINIHNEHDTFSGPVCDIVDEMWPITMPYWPITGKYKIYVEQLSADPENGDLDHIAVYYIIDPHGNKIDINRFYKETDKGPEEISEEEYCAVRENAEILK